MLLSPAVLDELHSLYHKALAEGRLLPWPKIQEYSNLFRERFGPDHLKRLNGEELLRTMHDHTNRGSLVYWLEFKNDEEFPDIFGGIGGGSALKFYIYKRKETGAWMTGSPQHQREITVEEAIQRARLHRDELIAGAQVLERLPLGADLPAYAQLEADMKKAAPYIWETAWGHKYLSILYPDKLDDFHNTRFQAFHLIKLGLDIPEDLGRYAAAGYFAEIARTLDIPIENLTNLLHQRNGRPYGYWRVGTRSDPSARPADRWPLMRDGGCVAMGWPELGDLTGLTDGRLTEDDVLARMKASYPNDPRALGRAVQQVKRFVQGIQEGDVVLAADGQTVYGVGKVQGGYSFDASSDFSHRRPVEWLDVGEWQLPHPKEGLLTTVHEVRQFANRVASERRLMAPQKPAPGPVSPPAPAPGTPTVGPAAPGIHKVPRLSGVPGRIQAVVDRKGQVILYGPPGTGKTHWAEAAARDLSSYQLFGKPFAELTEGERSAVIGPDGMVRMCAFHPAYGYEDFIEGYRPQPADGQMGFILRDGIFKRLCKDARRQRSRSFYLVIDEINRGDIPRIFGELLTLLEKNKRGKQVQLPLSGEAFAVPPNVHVIGTMNTADRSIALLDTALRRRFGFIELMPDYRVLDGVVGGIPVGGWLQALNGRILENIGRDARNLQVGHAYFLEGGRPVVDRARFIRIIQEDLVPLLEEYCYEDFDALEKILGAGLVDRRSRAVRHELFDLDHWDDLVSALLQPSPELMTSTAALAAETRSDGEGEADEDDAGEGPDVGAGDADVAATSEQ